MNRAVTKQIEHRRWELNLLRKAKDMPAPEPVKAMRFPKDDSEQDSERCTGNLLLPNEITRQIRYWEDQMRDCA